MLYSYTSYYVSDSYTALHVLEMHLLYVVHQPDQALLHFYSYYAPHLEVGVLPIISIAFQLHFNISKTEISAF